MSNTSEEPNSDTPTQKKEISEIPKILGFIIGFAGIYFLVISFFSILTILIFQGTSEEAGSMSADTIYTIALTISSILISGIAVLIGIKLIKYLDSGRKLFNGLTIAVIGINTLNYLYKKSIIDKSFANIPTEVAASLKGGELSGLAILFILPTILVIVAIVLNLRRVKRSLN